MTRVMHIGWICRDRTGRGYFACSCGKTVRIHVGPGFPYARRAAVTCLAYAS